MTRETVVIAILETLTSTTKISDTFLSCKTSLHTVFIKKYYSTVLALYLPTIKTRL